MGVGFHIGDVRAYYRKKEGGRGVCQLKPKTRDWLCKLVCMRAPESPALVLGGWGSAQALGRPNNVTPPFIVITKLELGLILWYNIHMQAKDIRVHPGP